MNKIWVRQVFFTLVCILILGRTSTLAASSSDQQMVLVDLADGSQLAFSLTERPQLLWEGDYVYFTTKGSKPVAVEKSSFRGVSFSGSSGIHTLTETKERIVYDKQGFIQIEGVDQTSAVVVYDASGRQVNQNCVSASQGSAIVNLSMMPSGIYVIKLNNQSSFKVVRP
jgi:hypothetical protein